MESLWGGWCSLEPIGTFRVGLWKNIKKGCDKFLGYSRLEAGDRTRISCWHDLWCGDTILKVAYRVLFGIACAKDSLVATNLQFLGGSN